MEVDVKELIPVLLAALMSAGLTYYLGIRKSRTEAELRFKAKRYVKVIEELAELFSYSSAANYKFGGLNEALFFSGDEG